MRMQYNVIIVVSYWLPPTLIDGSYAFFFTLQLDYNSKSRNVYTCPYLLIV
jgi:hypothetical protein